MGVARVGVARVGVARVGVVFVWAWRVGRGMLGGRGVCMVWRCKCGVHMCRWYNSPSRSITRHNLLSREEKMTVCCFYTKAISIMVIPS